MVSANIEFLRMDWANPPIPGGLISSCSGCSRIFLLVLSTAEVHVCRNELRVLRKGQKLISPP